MQPGQPETENPGLKSGLRILRKKKERTVSRSCRQQWAVWKVGGARCAGLAQFQALAQTYFTRVRRKSTTCSTSTGEAVHQLLVCTVPAASHFTHSVCLLWS